MLINLYEIHTLTFKIDLKKKNYIFCKSNQLIMLLNKHELDTKVKEFPLIIG